MIRKQFKFDAVGNIVGLFDAMEWSELISKDIIFNIGQKEPYLRWGLVFVRNIK